LKKIVWNKSVIKVSVLMSVKDKHEIGLMEKSGEMDTYCLTNLKNCFQVPRFHTESFLIGEESKEFKCNGSILAVISPVIRNLYLQNANAPIELPTITGKGFAALVRYGFSLDPEVGPDNVVDVIHAAKEIKVDIIYENALKYLNFILEHHTNVYFVTYLEQAAKFNLKEVILKCVENLGSVGGIKQFFKSKTFNEFSPEFLNILLSRDELPVEEEFI